MSSTNTSGRILGLDYGRRRIGVAQSDLMKITAQRLPTIQVRNLTTALEKIEQLVTQNGISQIVVGMPFNMKGEKGALAKEIDNFIQLLQKRLTIPIIEWDERLTSVEAKRILHELKTSPSRNKAKVDEISALIILQNYLNFIRK